MIFAIFLHSCFFKPQAIKKKKDKLDTLSCWVQTPANVYLVSTFQSCIFMTISEEKIASCPTYSNEDFDTQNNHLIGTFLFLLMSGWDKWLLM